MNERIWIPYCGAAPDPAGLIDRWNLDPFLVGFLAAIGAFGLVRTAGGPHERACLVAALLLTFLLFVSPLCALTSALFAARSAHHLALTALLAPLVAATLPRSRVPGGPVLWTALSATTLWLWHLPQLYAAALSDDLVYWLMQASLLGSATGFWLALRSTSSLAAVAALLAYMVQMGLLGALLTFSQTAFYAPHALTTAAWGFSPLEDQQLGGLVMWVPGALAYLLTALVRLHRLLEGEARPVAASA